VPRPPADDAANKARAADAAFEQFRSEYDEVIKAINIVNASKQLRDAQIALVEANSRYGSLSTMLQGVIEAFENAKRQDANSILDMNQQALAAGQVAVEHVKKLQIDASDAERLAANEAADKARAAEVARLKKAAEQLAAQQAAEKARKAAEQLAAQQAADAQTSTNEQKLDPAVVEMLRKDNEHAAAIVAAGDIMESKRTRESIEEYARILAANGKLVKQQNNRERIKKYPQIKQDLEKLLDKNYKIAVEANENVNIKLLQLKDLVDNYYASSLKVIHFMSRAESLEYLNSIETYNKDPINIKQLAEIIITDTNKLPALYKAADRTIDKTDMDRIIDEANDNVTRSNNITKHVTTILEQQAKRIENIADEKARVAEMARREAEQTAENARVAEMARREAEQTAENSRREAEQRAAQEAAEKARREAEQKTVDVPDANEQQPTVTMSSLRARSRSRTPSRPKVANVLVGCNGTVTFDAAKGACSGIDVEWNNFIANKIKEHGFNSATITSLGQQTPEQNFFQSLREPKQKYDLVFITNCGDAEKDSNFVWNKKTQKPNNDTIASRIFNAAKSLKPGGTLYAGDYGWVRSDGGRPNDVINTLNLNLNASSMFQTGVEYNNTIIRIGPPAE
jgi:hypothetical protein